eukprot:CAMPEP_0175672380 /NCGR_PEP_ID=MMETSP0097-20121207/20662_1 /TAXON_ID=311494 /ORGANISM="Alexandrium monilatum, Strain CCMP3105" /LENGTH=35 /DNA_ID= /DNA_START= /DNA_END= /DNA_ORIENTATION=
MVSRLWSALSRRGMIKPATPRPGQALGTALQVMAF